MEAKYTQVISNTTRIPIHMNIKRQDLIQNQPWFITDLDAADEYLDTVGVIHFEGNGSEQFHVRLELDYEFKFPMAQELAFLRAQSKTDPADPSKDTELKQAIQAHLLRLSANKA
jgi:hypothetical protein